MICLFSFLRNRGFFLLLWMYASRKYIMTTTRVLHCRFRCHACNSNPMHRLPAGSHFNLVTVVNDETTVALIVPAFATSRRRAATPPPSLLLPVLPPPTPHRQRPEAPTRASSFKPTHPDPHGHLTPYSVNPTTANPHPSAKWRGMARQWLELSDRPG